MSLGIQRTSKCVQTTIMTFIQSVSTTSTHTSLLQYSTPHIFHFFKHKTQTQDDIHSLHYFKKIKRESFSFIFLNI